MNTEPLQIIITRDTSSYTQPGWNVKTTAPSGGRTERHFPDRMHGSESDSYKAAAAWGVDPARKAADTSPDI